MAHARQRRWRFGPRQLPFALALVGIGSAGCATVLGIGDWSDLADDTPDRDATADALESGRALADAALDSNGAPGGDSGLDATTRDAATPDATTADASDSEETSALDASFDVALDGVAEAEGGPVSGTPEWAENFGTVGATTATSVTLDPSSGDIVVAGSFVGSVDFGGGTVTSQADASAGSDTFVARFDSSGKYRWAKTFGSGLFTSAGSVAVDASGNVVLGGTFQGSVDFGSGSAVSAVGIDDIFLVTFDSAGTHEWQTTFGAASQEQVLDTVAVDSHGNVVIAGRADSLDFGGGAKTGYYIAKFDSKGVYAWSNAFAATTVEGGPWLTLDPQDNCVLAGSFSNAVNFGGGSITSAGALDAFVAKYDASGAFVWAKPFGDSSSQWIASVATDASANIVVAGSFGGTISFGGPTLTASSGVNAFLAKLDTDGNGAWADPFLVPPRPADARIDLGAISVAVAGAGSPTLACTFLGSVNFGGGTLSSEGSDSIAVAHFDASGAFVWAYAGGAPSTADESAAANGTSVAVSETAVVLAGGFGTCGTTCTKSPLGTILVLGDETMTATSAEDHLPRKLRSLMSAGPCGSASKLICSHLFTTRKRNGLWPTIERSALFARRTSMLACRL